MSGLEFQDPAWLWFLLLLPLWILLRGRVGRDAAVGFSSVALAGDLPRHTRSRAGRILFSLRVLALAFLIVALARPRVGKGFSEVESSGVDIVLAVDVSGSMNALDFATQEDIATRLDIVKRTVADFIRKRPNDRIGLVAFARESFLISPLTLNHDWLLRNLERVDTGMVDGSQTAIGPAIGMSVNRLRDLSAETRLVVLLTDGEDNVNRIPPVAAAEAGKTFGVKIYTIAAGRTGRVPMPRTDNQGRVLRGRDGRLLIDRQYMNSRVDEETLEEIARVTGGRFFRATDKEELAEIYDEIDKLEKTEVKLRHYAEFHELFFWPLALGIVFLAVEQALANSRFRRLPG